jgi:hypothetical protein
LGFLLEMQGDESTGKIKDKKKNAYLLY